eukprot:TRINITY_DN13363_c0_g4_i1.p1 TRINITY_DN13363_c0_g4~~TRINITY_DN13363_c0_g4_i1.p1  ORF type:complete len:822 (+),score=167.29 TRINITY_DN13363_c0_g4_i1:101-2566(+)
MRAATAKGSFSLRPMSQTLGSRRGACADRERQTRKARLARARALFVKYDFDCSGTIGLVEFTALCQEMGIPADFASVVDDTGQVDFDTFTRWFETSCTAEQRRRSVAAASCHSGASGGAVSLDEEDAIPPASEALALTIAEGTMLMPTELHELRSIWEFFAEDSNHGKLTQEFLMELFFHCCRGLDIPAEDVEREVLRVWDILGHELDGKVSFGEVSSYLRWRDNDVLDIVGGTAPPNTPAPRNVREWVWAVVEARAAEQYFNPRLTRVANGFTLLSQFFVLFSIIILVVETVPELTSDDGEHGTPVTFGLEAACMLFFSAELLTRIGCSPDQRRLWISLIHFVDIITVLAFYARLAGIDNVSRAVTALRVLRLLRAARALKMVRHLQGVRLMGVALKRAGVALSWLFVLVVLSSTVSASLVFYAERDDATFNKVKRRWVRKANSTYGPPGEVIGFQSIPDTIWWAVVTLTTVGYGDMYPVTPLGKSVAALTMVAGLLVLAYPVTILCNTFDEVYREYTEKRAQRIMWQYVGKRRATMHPTAEIRTPLEQPDPAPASLGNGAESESAEPLKGTVSRDYAAGDVSPAAQPSDGKSPHVLPLDAGAIEPRQPSSGTPTDEERRGAPGFGAAGQNTGSPASSRRPAGSAAKRKSVAAAGSTKASSDELARLSKRIDEVHSVTAQLKVTLEEVIKLQRASFTLAVRSSPRVEQPLPQLQVVPLREPQPPPVVPPPSTIDWLLSGTETTLAASILSQSGGIEWGSRENVAEEGGSGPQCRADMAATLPSAAPSGPQEPPSPPPPPPPPPPPAPRPLAEDAPGNPAG